MDKTESKNIIIGAILLTVSFFFIFFFLDGTIATMEIFGELSDSFSRQMINLFGTFPLLFFSIGIYLAFMFLIKIKLSTKILTSTGFISLIVFIPSFWQTINVRGFSGGYFGKAFSDFFLQSGFVLAILLHFFWFFFSIFSLFFPFRTVIVSNIILLFDKFLPNQDSNEIVVKNYANKTRENIQRDRNSNSSSKKESKVNQGINFKKRDRYNKQNKFGFFNKGEKKQELPWVSKIVYETPDNRVEIPVIPNDEKGIKKFKLKEKKETGEEFEEVDTFSGNPPNVIYEKINELNEQEADYYERLKKDWPENWKDNQLNKQETENSDENIIKQLPYNENNNLIEKSNPPLAIEEELQETDDNIEDAEVVIIEDASFENDKDNVIDAGLLAKSKIINSYKAKKEEEENRNNIENSILSSQDDAQVDFDRIYEKNFKDSLPDSEILGTRQQPVAQKDFGKEEKEAAVILENTLQEFGIKAEVSDIVHGPVVTLFKLIPAPGIKLSKIEGLSNNLALRLAAKSIRIIAPIPGEKVVGIEIPNKRRQLVSFNEVVNSEEFTETSMEIPVGIGKDIYGKIIVIDIYKMPHILIAGATGAGKSVCVNSFLSSILFSRTPDEVKLVLIDPKIVELKPYNNIPHLLTPVITDPKKAILALRFLIYEMERRYSLLDVMGVRDIVEYRKVHKKKKSTAEQLPFIVTIVDEFADLMSTSGKETEMLFARLTAKARAVGIHLVLATQRPSTDVITGLIKANVPARIAFQVISLQDSRIILDQKGAEKLLGQGDMLYLSPTQPFSIRLQGAFLDKDEVDTIADHWKSIAEPDYINLEEILGEDDEQDYNGEHKSKDPLFDEALEIVINTRKASASYLQRRLNIGYNRAARLIEEMEALGVVGPLNGSKPREVIVD